jgi:hypothetical protein
MGLKWMLGFIAQKYKDLIWIWKTELSKFIFRAIGLSKMKLGVGFSATAKNQKYSP